MSSLKIIIDKTHLEQLKELSSEFNDANFMFFYIDSNILDFNLKDYDALVFFNPCCYAPDEKGFTGQFNDKEKEAIQNYVKNGGCLIVTTGFPVEDNPNREDALAYFSKMLNVKKIIDGILFASNEKEYRGSKKNIICVPAKKEYAEGLKYVLAYESNLFIPNEKSEVILNGPKNTSFKSEEKVFENLQKPPIAITKKLGKGLIMGISSTQMFMPITKNKTVPVNNKQFLVNIFNSLLKEKEKKEFAAI